MGEIPAKSAVPDWMKGRNQWRLWSYDKDKMPLDENKTGKEWNDPGCWLSFEGAYELAKTDSRFDGIGFVVSKADPYFGIDVDSALREPNTEKPKDWVPSPELFVDTAYAQFSTSGTGFHLFGKGNLPEWWSNEHFDDREHEGVEAYEEKFFIVTGNELSISAGEPQEVDPTPWLLKAYQELYGRLPRELSSSDSDRGDYDGDSDLSKESVEDALSKLDPSMVHDEWVRVGFAVHAWDSGSTGKSVFESWSRGSSKYDNAAQNTIDWIWSNADDNGDVSVGTLVHKAKKEGWSYPKKTTDGGATTTTGGGTSDTSISDTSDIHETFRNACAYYQIEAGKIATRTFDGEKQYVGVGDILPTTGIDDAVMLFNREADNLDGTDKQAVIGRVVFTDLQDSGEFFKTDDGRLYYFFDDETEVYRVDPQLKNRTLSEEFQGMVWERYNLFSGSFSRNLGKDLKSQARRAAPKKDVYQFAHYNDSEGELYLTDWGNGYYAVSPTAIEWRPNGTDVYFLPDDRAEPFEYLPPEERESLPQQIPGERPMWGGSGDPIMRLFGNRINYDENATLGPTEQRKQLYLHLHTLPFIDVLNARPIMAWVGKKGSGKSMIQRSIGRFLYGDGYKESVMPDSKDDFLAKVTNQALAFVDNYDDGVDWANDLLAAIATGAGIDKRELYTTNTLRRETPRCWLSLTSRDPPFRRDDVADRLLVFRVQRFSDNEFIGEGVFQRQVTQYRDTLWSTYLDNIQQVLAEYERRDMGTMSSSHRMADWAIFAQATADALDVSGVDNLLETMETERASFALENEPWAATIDEWIDDDPNDASTWRSASSLVDRLNEVADSHNLSFTYSRPQGLGGKLSQYESELSELYNLEIHEGHTNEYRFNVTDETTATGLGRY
ncbi:PriCT-2 domain-containing protein [Halapricum hydrolyticum]|uniref:PriCT-2 domain-containing protein n=1 Tax=Halapricum hydrolyticum TaxID=2979991 RepID=A0AAE3LH16_9EURY|nr:PriCT-2 domain-containing protein [Halapricum hydrolyticum]MCU4718378.1 PriCT-2 domain-containing protein [Halapricum hydrolyticum]MCU4726509.1 PriCT-2 domain-containing protein [Halapricum hydrolyticum]